jgi:hypothetical protein
MDFFFWQTSSENDHLATLLLNLKFHTLENMPWLPPPTKKAAKVLSIRSLKIVENIGKAI